MLELYLYASDITSDTMSQLSRVLQYQTHLKVLQLNLSKSAISNLDFSADTKKILDSIWLTKLLVPVLKTKLNLEELLLNCAECLWFGDYETLYLTQLSHLKDLFLRTGKCPLSQFSNLRLYQHHDLECGHDDEGHRGELEKS